MPRRTSLSDWYQGPTVGVDSPQGSTPEHGVSPTKCVLCPSQEAAGSAMDMEAFYIGDRSRDLKCEESPRKRRFINSVQGDDSTMLLLRGICVDYFEHHVAPIFKCIQQGQDQLSSQLKELSEIVKQKASVRNVVSREEMDGLTARIIASDAKQLAAAATTGAQQEELEARLHVSEQKVAALTTELHDLKTSLPPTASGTATSDAADMAKLKAAFVSCGLRYEKQIKEIRAQVQRLQEKSSNECASEEPFSSASIGERWPGRKISTGGESDADSDNMSSVARSESFAGSMWNAEDKAELRKIRTVFQAASTMVAKDLKDVRSQMRDLRGEVEAMKNESRA